MVFSKIIKDNTIFIEKSSVGLFEHNGVFVDIFPLDFINNPNILSYKIQMITLVI